MLGELRCLCGVYLLFQSCRDPSPEFPRSDFRAFEHDRPSGNDRSFTDFCAVEHHGVHSDQCLVVDRCRMYDRPMSERYFIAKDSRESLGLMDAGQILDVAPVSDDNLVHIRPENGTKPYRTILAQGNVTG